MKFKFLNTRIVGAAAVLFFSLNISAAPIYTDFTTINGNDWARADAFTFLSWSDINDKCSGVQCADGSVLNDYDMTGWSWASKSELNALFDYVTKDYATTYDTSQTIYESNSLWAPALIEIFGATYNPGGNPEMIRGTYNTSTIPSYLDSNSAYVEAYEVGNYQGSNFDWYRTDAGELNKHWTYADRGGMFLRSSGITDVPEPSTLAIFALGLMGLASRRFKKQA
jgi:hypothetical protein